MKTEILYNGINPFSGLGPTPFVGKSDSMVRLHDRWAVTSNITLDGLVTGNCPNDFEYLYNQQQELLRRFSSDFKSLSITENGQQIYSAPYCWIDNISFPSDKYVRAVPYIISINCFQENLFSGLYGVQNPSQNISWEEDDEGIITITRNISAKGFNTSSVNRTNNAFNNARTYVQGLTGWNTSYFADSLPHFISYNTNLVPCVKEIRENINRLEANYGVEMVYRYNPSGSSSNLLKYTTEFNYNDENGIYNASINGTFEGCPDLNYTVFRNEFKNIDLYSITNYEFRKSYPNPLIDLNPEFLSENFSENTNQRVITFSKSWDSDPRDLVLFDYDLTKEVDVLADIITISLQGTISARDSQKTRWERVLAYYQNNINNIFNIANNFYLQQGGSYSLVKYPLSFSATENPIQGTIDITASYNDRIQPPPGFDDWNYVIEIKPSIIQKVAVPVLCGDYKIIDTNASTRSNIAVNGEIFNLQGDSKQDIARDIFKSIIAQNIETPNRRRIIKSDNISTSLTAQGLNYSVDESESYDGPIFTL